MSRQIERIVRMEQILDDAAAAVKVLSDALEEYARVQPAICELTAYYSSGEWLRDFEADSAGLLPKDLKRGVLSEDAVFDLLSDLQRLRTEMTELANSNKGGSV